MGCVRDVVWQVNKNISLFPTEHFVFSIEVYTRESLIEQTKFISAEYHVICNCLITDRVVSKYAETISVLTTFNSPITSPNVILVLKFGETELSDQKIILHTSERYLELNQTSTIELFCKNSERLKAINYVRKKAPSHMFAWALNSAPVLSIRILKFSIRKPCLHLISYIFNI